MPAKSQELQELPGFSQGVRPSAALRDVTLAQPICPKSQIRGKVVNGSYEPPEIGPEDANCQLMKGEWWVECEKKGHDPYFRTVKTYHTVDVTEKDPETGETFVIGTKKKVIETRVPNVTQVSPDKMHNSGMGVGRKMRVLGYRRLTDLGFKEVCQFRGCQKLPQFRSPGLGDYCSLEHLNLIAARAENEMLVGTGRDHQGLDAGLEEQIAQKRTRQLREVMPRQVEPISA